MGLFLIHGKSARIRLIEGCGNSLMLCSKTSQGSGSAYPHDRSERPRVSTGQFQLISMHVSDLGILGLIGSLVRSCNGYSILKNP
jgi:hypothetical protein